MTSLPASDPGSAAVWDSKRINPRPQSCLCLTLSGYLFKRRRRRRRRHVRVIQDENSNVMVNSEAVLKRWKEYFEKLMNEENNRDPRTEETELVNEEINCVSREEVKNALRRMKKVKRLGQMSCL